MQRKPSQQHFNLALEVIEQISIMSTSFLNQIPADDKKFEKFVHQWGRSIEQMGDYPNWVFLDAVDVLFLSPAGNEYNITPYHFSNACKVAVERAMMNPSKRHEIEKHRVLRQAKFDQMLEQNNH